MIFSFFHLDPCIITWEINKNVWGFKEVKEGENNSWIRPVFWIRNKKLTRSFHGKSIQYFIINPADKPTKRQTGSGENISCLVEVITPA